MNDDGKRDLWSAAEAACDAGWQMKLSDTGQLSLQAPHGACLVFTGLGPAHGRTARNLGALVDRYRELAA